MDTLMKISTFNRKILISIVAVIITTILLTGVLSYTFSNKMLEKRIYNDNLLLLDTVRSTADQKLSSVYKNGVKLSQNKDIQYFLSHDFRIGDYIIFSKITEELETLTELDSSINSIYLYSTRNGRIIYDAIYKLEEFFDTTWLDNIKEERSSLWIPLRASGKYESVDNQNPVLNFITLAIPVRMNGWIIINLDIDELFNNINKVIEYDYGEIFIIDLNQGSIVKSQGMLTNDQIDTNQLIRIMQNSFSENNSGSFKRNIDDKSFVISSIMSEFNGWIYVSCISTDSVLEQTLSLKRMFIWLIIAVLLVGLSLSLILEKKIYGPIGNLVQYILRLQTAKNHYTSKDEFDFIKNSINEIITEQKQISDFVLNHELELREIIFDRYIIADKKPAIDVLKEITDFDFNLKYKYCYFINIKELEEEVFDPELVQRKLKNHLKNDADIYIFKYRKIYSIIVNCSSASAIHELNEKDIYRLTDSSQNKSLKVGISSVGTLPVSLKQLFFEASKALKVSMIMKDQHAVFYEEIKSIGLKIKYPLNIENNIIASIKSGDRDLIEKCLGTIPEYLKKNNIVNAFDIHFILINLLGKIADCFSVNASIVFDMLSSGAGTDTEKDIYTIYTGFEFAVLTMFDTYSKCNGNPQQELMSKIFDYIRDNYTKDIALQDISDKFNYSKGHICKLFRDFKGDTFNNILNSLRIEKAKELLETSDIPIKDISDQLGYNDSRSLIRYFKLYEGQTPFQYRSNNKN